MFNLSSYLEKFKNTKESKNEKETIKKILLEEVNLSVSEKNILFSKDEIKITGSSFQKNIIFLKKDVLLQKKRAYISYEFF